MKIKHVCKWECSEKAEEIWETDCKNRFVFIDGTPKENGFRFCPYCGEEIVEVVK